MIGRRHDGWIACENCQTLLPRCLATNSPATSVGNLTCYFRKRAANRVRIAIVIVWHVRVFAEINRFDSFIGRHALCGSGFHSGDEILHVGDKSVDRIPVALNSAMPRDDNIPIEFFDRFEDAEPLDRISAAHHWDAGLEYVSGENDFLRGKVDDGVPTRVCVSIIVEANIAAGFVQYEGAIESEVSRNELDLRNLSHVGMLQVEGMLQLRPCVRGQGSALFVLAARQ